MPDILVHSTQQNQPLIDAFSGEQSQGLTVHPLSVEDVQWRFENVDADLALASPLLFVKRESDLVLLQGACVAAVGATTESILIFNSDLREFGTIGYYGNDDIDVMLARIVMIEKYGMSPKFVPVRGHLREALAAMDAVLLRNPDDLPSSETMGTIDMYDEWFDLTELPFVREVVIGWEQRVDAELDNAIARAGHAVDAQTIEAVQSEIRGRMALTVFETVPGHHRYQFNDVVLDGLMRFFTFAFSHGLRENIPTFQFWTPDTEERTQ